MAQLDVFVSPQGRSCNVPNTADGHAALLAALPMPGTCRITLEATGNYSQRLVAVLVDAGHYVSVANPRQIRFLIVASAPPVRLYRRNLPLGRRAGERRNFDRDHRRLA